MFAYFVEFKIFTIAVQVCPLRLLFSNIFKQICNKNSLQ